MDQSLPNRLFISCVNNWLYLFKINFSGCFLSGMFGRPLFLITFVLIESFNKTRKFRTCFGNQPAALKLEINKKVI